MRDFKGGLAALAYGAILWALNCISVHLLPQRHFCSDVSVLGHIQARTSLGMLLPVPVVQLCSADKTAAILILGIVAASCAWAALLRWMPRALVVIPCMAAGILSALFFPYIATTDPYAYGVYGYEALLGQNPYSPAAHVPEKSSRALQTLYTFFPSGSVDRTANYGAIAVVQYREIARASGDSLGRFIMLGRLTNAALLCVLAWLLTLLRPPGAGRLQSAFVAFHPVVLVESIAFVHGDILMLVFLCAALVAYRKGAIEVCALLIVLATEVRVIAGVALLVLLMKAGQEHDRRTVLRAIVASSITVAMTAALTIGAYGTFTLGGSPALGPYTSPLLLAFNAADASMHHIAIGGASQALLGLAFVGWLMLAQKYEYVPFSALAVLPIVRAWYCQWLVPLIAIEGRANVSYAAAALAGIGIVTEWPEMTGHSDAIAWAVILCLQWILPVVAWSLHATHNNKPLLKAPTPTTSVT